MQRPIFFRIPTPETAPGLIGPDAAEDCAGEAEERGEADDGVNHFGKGFAEFDLATAFCDCCFHGLSALNASGGKSKPHSPSFT